MSADRTLHEGEFLRLKRRDHWEYVERANARGAVVIVALTPNNEVLLVEQPRFPVQAQVIELPAGLVGDIEGEENEALEVAAARELEEETGYRAARFEYLCAGPPSAGLANEIIAFYRAFDLERIDGGGGDDSEQITPHAVPLAEVEGWLAAREAEGVRIDPKIYAGLYFVMRERR
ncbi:NUDIX hydrolase [Endozoicomonas sp. G2_2]|uniref:NUDIX hydrolase n=1 Tax=Endozoicomonas sp. G2_2 TaxID=2821092 RepID=UPI001ADC8978|nr:NUDIX hydrolase [Endozoicomonas sp. G2_2]MBO9469587.1 NUDIX hydrolase [Endozoicomonas sp. G2_2]